MPSGDGPARTIRTAVVTGQHPIDVRAFNQLFRTLPEVDFYPQHLDDFGAASEEERRWYDVVVFYHFHQATPGAEQGWWETGIRAAIEGLGETDQGILVLHHAILAFPDWPLWSELCGIRDRRFGYHPGQTLRINVADSEHPITRSLPDWEMVDETYTMADAGDGSEILLTTEHPLSMRTIAWARRFRNARVLCFQSGHDGAAFTHPQVRTVMARGIRWLAGRSDGEGGGTRCGRS